MVIAPARREKDRSSLGAVALSVLLTLCGCNSLFGIDDLEYSEPTNTASQGGASGGSTSFGGAGGTPTGGMGGAGSPGGSGGIGGAGGLLQGGNQPTPEVLVTGQTSARGITVDETRVYWTSSLKIGSALLDGSDSETITAGYVAWSITQDADTIYWVHSEADGSVIKVPKSDYTAITPLCGQQDTPLDLAIHSLSGYLYWTANDRIMRINPTGVSVPTTLASGEPDVEAPEGIAVDDSFVYWADFSNAIKKIPLNGGPTITVVSGQPIVDYPKDLAVDDTSVYWTNFNSQNSVAKADKVLGTAVVLAQLTAGDQPFGIALDSTHVYWTTNIGGGVYRVSKSGGPLETLASNQANPAAIAVDQTHVYWVNRTGGQVMRIAK